MGRHSESVTEEPQEKPQQSRKWLPERHMPHFGMAGVTLLYVGYSLALGGAGVPQTISLAFTATLGAWFNYLIQQRANKGD